MNSGSTPLIDISVVLPTRNRRDSLERVLGSLARQKTPVLEVIIVDASDVPTGHSELSTTFPSLPILVIRSEPHVCIQRNIGIRKARGSYIFLCDDDIEVPDDYTERIITYLTRSTSPRAVSGLLLEPDQSGVFDDGSRSLSVPSLFSAFLFQHGLWGNVNSLRRGKITSPPLSFLKWYFRKRGNRFSLAGWPLFTQMNLPSTETAVYGLGAAVVPRDWLIRSPYDETLGTYGIGDNYGVSLGFPGTSPITILADLPVMHHKAGENRLPAGEVYKQRVVALHRYVRKDPRFGIMTRIFLIWSLLGRIAVMSVRGKTGLRNSAGVALFDILKKEISSWQ